MDFKIDLSKTCKYRTRNGGVAHIYREVSPDGHVTHYAGEVGYAYGYWTPYGNFIGGNQPTANPRDLVEPVVEKPVVPWDQLPEHIKFVACDQNGMWWGYLDKPHKLTRTYEISQATYNTIFCLRPEHRPAFAGSWEDSLVARPE